MNAESLALVLCCSVTVGLLLDICLHLSVVVPIFYETAK